MKKIIHANAVVIKNKGILILGESGTGKSELCLELLYDGHQLIADDAVELEFIHPHIHLNAIPSHYRHLHINELGLLNLQKSFPENQFVFSHSLDFAIRLNPQSSSVSKKHLLAPQWQTLDLAAMGKIPLLEMSDCRQRAVAHLLTVLVDSLK